MLPKIGVVSKALEQMYNATAAIYGSTATVAAHHITRSEPEKLGEVRCRISYKRIEATISTGTVDRDTQQIIMIYDGSVDIPDGSMIAVTFDDGHVDKFNNSGLPKRYQYTWQVRLVKCEDKP